VPSCTNRSENDFPAPAAGNVNVQFAVSVTSCIVAVVTSGNVSAEPDAETVLTDSMGEYEEAICRRDLRTRSAVIAVCVPWLGRMMSGTIHPRSLSGSLNVNVTSSDPSTSKV
jgi:hypothetical protein